MALHRFCIRGIVGAVEDEKTEQTRHTDRREVDYRRQTGEGRIKRLRRLGTEIRHEPRSALDMMRSAAITVWAARGGGFYGLGYLVTFLILEVRMFAGEYSESTGAVDFITSQALEFVFRISLMSFFNGLMAFVWPFFVIEWLGGTWGLFVLLVGYVVVEKGIRPQVEGRWPELKLAREEAARVKAGKAGTDGKAGKAVKGGKVKKEPPAG